MANTKQQAEQELRKWFNDKVTVMTFGDDKNTNGKLKKIIQNKFIKKIKGE